MLWTCSETATWIFTTPIITQKLSSLLLPPVADGAVIMWGAEILAQALVQGRHRSYTTSLCLCSPHQWALQLSLCTLWELRPSPLCLLGTCATVISRGWSSPRHKSVELKHCQKAVLCNLSPFLFFHENGTWKLCATVSPVLWSHMVTIFTHYVPYHMHKSWHILKAVSLSVLEPPTVQQTMNTLFQWFLLLIQESTFLDP